MDGWQLVIWIASGAVVVGGIMWLINLWVKSGNKKPPMPDKVTSPYESDDTMPLG